MGSVQHGRLGREITIWLELEQCVHNAQCQLKCWKYMQAESEQGLDLEESRALAPLEKGEWEIDSLN